MKRITLSMVILLWIFAVNAQSVDLFVIASAGNFMGNQDVSLSATLGEVMIETYSAGEIILTQGFQQSGLTIETYINERGSEWDILVFPNPVTDELRIDFSGDYQGEIHIELFDLKGRKIIHRSMEKSSFRHLCTQSIYSIAKGIYILKITTSDFRINKITRIEIQ